MANVVVAESSGYDLENNLILVEIIGPAILGAPITLTAGYPLCKIRWSRDENEIFAEPFMHSEAEFNLLETGNASSLIAAITQAQDNIFSIRVSYVSDPNELFWCGNILPDTITVELGCIPANIQIRASDGIRSLENYNTHNQNDVFGDNFYAMMNELSCFTENFVSSAQSVFFSPYFSVTGASNQVFKDVYFLRTFDNDYEYLKAVLNDLGMYLVHTNGAYFMISVFDISSGSLSGTWYKEASLGVISSTTLTYSTIVSATDTGGLRRWTRPFLDVSMEFNGSDKSYGLQKSETYSPFVTSDYQVVLDVQVSEAFFGTLDFDVWIQAYRNPSSSSDVCQGALLVQYGTKYYTVKNGWSTTFGLVFYEDMYNPGTTEPASIWPKKFSIDFANSGVTADANFKVSTYATVGSAIMYQMESYVNIVADDDIFSIFNTGTSKPIYEAVNHFMDSSIIGMDRMFSSTLNDYINDVWTCTLGTGYLHRIRAESLKDNLELPKEMIEAYIDNVEGPAAFYNVKNNKVVPVRIDFDLIRKEGSITGWKVGTL